MRILPILVAIAAALLLGACGSDVEESAGTSGEMAEGSAGAPDEMDEGSADSHGGMSTEAAISADRLAYRIRAGSPPLILDIRKSEEFALGHIPGAINIPLDELPARLSELPAEKGAEIIIVQFACGRSFGKAAAVLRKADYPNVRELTGHWRHWKGAKLPTE